MGIFDIFLSEEQRIAKEQRTLTNRDSQPEDRENSARWLAERDKPKAWVALLTRFDMKLENQLKDRNEKDLVYSLLTQAGAEALARPLERHLKKCRQVATPLRLHQELMGLDATIAKAYEILDIEREKDDFKPQKKVDILVWLVDYPRPEHVEQTAPLLEDFDENVRCAVIEVLVSTQEDAARPLLEKAMVKPDEESNRLRVRVAQIFQQRGWTVDEPEAFGNVLPDGYTVNPSSKRVTAS
ncbi:MAG: hypothetical protein AAGA48_08140 [Myxococcota bacterium]